MGGYGSPQGSATKGTEEKKGLKEGHNQGTPGHVSGRESCLSPSGAPRRQVIGV